MKHPLSLLIALCLLLVPMRAASAEGADPLAGTMWRAEDGSLYRFGPWSGLDIATVYGEDNYEFTHTQYYLDGERLVIGLSAAQSDIGDVEAVEPQYADGRVVLPTGALTPLTRRMGEQATAAPGVAGVWVDESDVGMLLHPDGRVSALEFEGDDLSIRYESWDDIVWVDSGDGEQFVMRYDAATDTLRANGQSARRLPLAEALSLGLGAPYAPEIALDGLWADGEGARLLLSPDGGAQSSAYPFAPDMRYSVSDGDVRLHIAGAEPIDVGSYDAETQSISGASDYTRFPAPHALRETAPEKPWLAGRWRDVAGGGEIAIAPDGTMHMSDMGDMGVSAEPGTEAYAVPLSRTMAAFISVSADESIAVPAFYDERFESLTLYSGARYQRVSYEPVPESMRGERTSDGGPLLVGEWRETGGNAVLRFERDGRASVDGAAEGVFYNYQWRDDQVLLVSTRIATRGGKPEARAVLETMRYDAESGALIMESGKRFERADGADSPSLAGTWRARDIPDFEFVILEDGSFLPTVYTEQMPAWCVLAGERAFALSQAEDMALEVVALRFDAAEGTLSEGETVIERVSTDTDASGEPGSQLAWRQTRARQIARAASDPAAPLPQPGAGARIVRDDALSQRLFAPFDEPPVCLGFSPDGSVLLANAQGTLMLFDMESGASSAVLPDLSRSEPGAQRGLADLLALTGDPNKRAFFGPEPFAWSPDGRYVAFTNGAESMRTLRLSTSLFVIDTLTASAFTAMPLPEKFTMPGYGIIAKVAFDDHGALYCAVYGSFAGGQSHLVRYDLDARRAEYVATYAGDVYAGALQSIGGRFAALSVPREASGMSGLALCDAAGIERGARLLPIGIRPAYGELAPGGRYGLLLSLRPDMLSLSSEMGLTLYDAERDYAGLRELLRLPVGGDALETLSMDELLRMGEADFTRYAADYASCVNAQFTAGGTHALLAFAEQGAVRMLLMDLQTRALTPVEVPADMDLAALALQRNNREFTAGYRCYAGERMIVDGKLMKLLVE